MASNVGIGSVGFALSTLNRNRMAKKQSGSSQPAKPVSVSSESIWNKPLTKRQKAVLDGVAMRQTSGVDSQIDYSDLPALSDKQLVQFKRIPRKLAAVRYRTAETNDG